MRKTVLLLSAAALLAGPALAKNDKNPAPAPAPAPTPKPSPAPAPAPTPAPTPTPSPAASGQGQATNNPSNGNNGNDKPVGNAGGNGNNGNSNAGGNSNGNGKGNGNGNNGNSNGAGNGNAGGNGADHGAGNAGGNGNAGDNGNAGGNGNANGNGNAGGNGNGASNGNGNGGTNGNGNGNGGSGGNGGGLSQPVACAPTDLVPGASACSGFFSGNLLGGSDKMIEAQIAGLQQVGFTWDGAWDKILKIDSLQGATTLDFGVPLFGESYIGLHFGGGGPLGVGNGTAFYKLDVQNGVAGLASMVLNYPGSSGAVLYKTGVRPVTPPVTVDAVPEPATWAMMIAGFAAVGFAARRRSSTARAPA